MVTGHRSSPSAGDEGQQRQQWGVGKGERGWKREFPPSKPFRTQQSVHVVGCRAVPETLLVYSGVIPAVI